MAVIKITKELLFAILQEKLILPNTIEELSSGDQFTFHLKTKIKGKSENEEVVPIYERRVDGVLYLRGFV